MSAPIDGGRPPVQRLVLIAVVFEGALAVVAVLLGWWLACPPAKAIHWTWRGAGWGVVACLPLIGVLLATVSLPVPGFKRLRRFFDRIVVPLFRQCTWLDLAVISAVAGLGEEALFRGVIQEVIARWTGEAAGPWIGLAIASVLFGLAHAVTPTYAVMATLMGAYLGWLWIVTGNLLVPITTHAVYDFIALGYLVKLPGRQRPTKPAEAEPGPGDTQGEPGGEQADEEGPGL